MRSPSVEIVEPVSVQPGPPSPRKKPGPVPKAVVKKFDDIVDYMNRTLDEIYATFPGSDSGKIEAKLLRVIKDALQPQGGNDGINHWNVFLSYMASHSNELDPLYETCKYLLLSVIHVLKILYFQMRLQSK